MRELEQIKGIGAATAEALADLTPAVETLHDLVEWDTEALAESLEGASVTRVVDWQAQAIMLLAARAEEAEAAEKGMWAFPEDPAEVVEEEPLPPSAFPVEDGKVRVWVHAREGRYLPGKGLGSRLYGDYFLVTPQMAAYLTKADAQGLRLERVNE